MNDVITFEQSVKARVKEIIGELIPEETWDNIIRQTIDGFIKVDLPNLVRRELTDKYKKIITEELSKPEWQTKYVNGHQVASDLVSEIIKNSAGDILVSLIGGISQQITYDIQNKVSSFRY